MDLVTYIDMVLMEENGIRGGIYYYIYWYSKANNKYMKDHDKDDESSYLKYWDVINLYVWAMSQNVAFECIKDTSQLTKIS